MYQRTELLGRLGGDGELRSTQSGQSVLNFSLAVTEKWKDGEGEKQERTTWFKCAMWGKRGEAVAPYIKKGGVLFVAGTVQADSYVSNQTHETVNQLKLNVRELTFVSSKNENSGGAAARPAEERNEFDGQGEGFDHSGPQISDEDIPF